jgi:hypothetical protein
LAYKIQSSSLKPLGRLEPSVAGISYSVNVCVFGVAWKPGTILYSNLLKIEKKMPLFKSVFKSCRFDKYASTNYLNTTINSISFCFC